MPVVNEGLDTHCLARAICIGLEDRQHRLQHRPNAHFKLWAQGQYGAAGTAAARQLMEAAGVPLGQQHYGVRDAQKIQQHLDAQLGAQQVRLLLLERERAFQVAWKAPQPAHFTLTLVCVNQHWSYIQYPHQLFNVRTTIHNII